MSLTENPYAIFDKSSIKEGDYISHPPSFTLYNDDGDGDNNKHRPRAISANNNPLQLNNAGRGPFRGSTSRGRGGNRQPTPIKFQKSEGYGRGNNFLRNNRRFNTRRGDSNYFGDRRNYSNSSSHSHHDDVFMSSNGGLHGPNPNNPCFLQPFTSNGHFGYGMPPPYFEAQQSFMAIPPFDVVNFPPLHHHPNQQKRTFTPNLKWKPKLNQADNAEIQKGQSQSWPRRTLSIEPITDLITMKIRALSFSEESPSKPTSAAGNSEETRKEDIVVGQNGEKQPGDGEIE